MLAMSHLACFAGSIPNGVANVQVPFVNDQILTRLNNNVILPEDGKLILAAGIGLNLSRGRLNTAAARFVGLPALVPVNVGTTVPNVPNIMDYSAGPLTIPRADEIEFQSTHSGAAAQLNTYLALFQFGFKPIPGGQTYRIRGTAAVAGAASTWLNGPITLEQTLPRGVYAIVGLDVVGTNCFAARLSIPGSPYRPGCLCRETVGAVPAPIFRNGTLGVYGQFDSTSQPSLDVLGIGAITTQEVFMDVILLTGGSRF